MRVLVTGHDGYIGSVLSPMLREGGHDVVGLDTFFYEGCDFGAAPHTGARVAPRHQRRQSRTLEGLRRGRPPRRAVERPARRPRVPPGRSRSTSRARFSLARAATEAGVSRFIFASSCSMYGTAGDDAPLREDAPLRPLTAYAESKVRAEEALRELAGNGFSPVSMRNATAYGVSPRLRLDIVVNNLVAWAHTTGSIRLLSDGMSWRPLVHVRDIARAGAGHSRGSARGRQRASFQHRLAGADYRIRELAEVVHRRLPRCEVTYAADASPDPRSYRVDFSKFAATFQNCTFACSPESRSRRARERVRGRRPHLEHVRGRSVRSASAGSGACCTTDSLDDSLRWRVDFEHERSLQPAAAASESLPSSATETSPPDASRSSGRTSRAGSRPFFFAFAPRAR